MSNEIHSYPTPYIIRIVSYPYNEIIFQMEVIRSMNILLHTNSKEPLFQQIKEQIKEQILNGNLEAGDALPSMRLLAKELKISVITTKRAYEELEQEGYVISTVGKGTFVSGQQPHILKEWQMRELENDLEKMIQTAKKLGVTKKEVIDLLNVYYEEEI